MGYRVVFVSFYKGIVFTTVLLLVSFIIKFSFNYNHKPKWWHQNRLAEDTTFYFIGSSRVQRSISPDLLKMRLPNYNFINLGVSGNSFLYSCQIASQLVQDSLEKKIIFIELTGLSIQPCDAYYFLMSQNDVLNVIQKHLSIQCGVDDLSVFLFHLFSIHSDLKKIFFPDLNLYNSPEIGYLSDTKKVKASINGVLSPQSFTIKTEISPHVLDAYLQNIDMLQNMAARSNNQVIFVLPLTIVKKEEFNIDMSVFAKLPEHSKWSYSNEFMSSMQNSSYLFDELHLNKEGSTIYSRELSKFIEIRF